MLCQKEEEVVIMPPRPTWYHPTHVVSPDPCGITRPTWYHPTHVVSPDPHGITRPTWYHPTHVVSPDPHGITRPTWYHPTHVVSPRPTTRIHVVSPVFTWYHLYSRSITPSHHPYPRGITPIQVLPQPMWYIIPTHVVPPDPCGTTPTHNHPTHVVLPLFTWYHWKAQDVLLYIYIYSIYIYTIYIYIYVQYIFIYRMSSLEYVSGLRRTQMSQRRNAKPKSPQRTDERAGLRRIDECFKKCKECLNVRVNR